MDAGSSKPAKVLGKVADTRNHFPSEFVLIPRFSVTSSGSLRCYRRHTCPVWPLQAQLPRLGQAVDAVQAQGTMGFTHGYTWAIPCRDVAQEHHRPQDPAGFALPSTFQKGGGHGRLLGTAAVL